MNENAKRELSKYRMARSKKLTEVSQENLSLDLQTSINRSYYAVFEAMRAILALDGFDTKKHSGVISEFRKKYIKTNILPEHLSDIVKTLFLMRNDSDYDDFFIISKEEASTQLKNAEEFYNTVSAYLEVRWQNE